MKKILHLPFGRGKQRGASLVETVIASAIVIGSASVAANATNNDAEMQRGSRFDQQMDHARGLIQAVGRNAARDQWDVATPAERCFVGANFVDTLTKTTRVEYGDKSIELAKFTGTYVSRSGRPIPASWTTMVAACNTMTGKDACVRVKLLKRVDLADPTKDVALSTGFFIARANPYSFKTNATLSTCGEETEQAGYGYKMNYKLYLEGTGSNFKEVAFHSLFANTTDSKAIPPQANVVVSGLQGEDMLTGWRASWTVPPKPGPAYDAWPVPYEKVGSYVVDKQCKSFFGFTFCKSTAQKGQELGWMCDGTLFNSKCDKHPKFK